MRSIQHTGSFPREATAHRWQVSATGITLLEVAVVIGLVGLLAALLLPAVQSLRSSARLLECQNHLRQLGVALTNYEAVEQVLPPFSLRGDCESQTIVTRLFPYLELPGFCGIDAARARHMPLLTCPTDTDGARLDFAVSYAFNAGLGDDFGTPTHGLFSTLEHVPRRLSEVTDGLSRTASISEHAALVAGGALAAAENQPWLYYWFVHIPPPPDTSLPSRRRQTEESLARCYDGPRKWYQRDDPLLARWHRPLPGDPSPPYSVTTTAHLYAHGYQPNSPNCNPLPSYVDSPFMDWAEFGASSLHQQGVNVAFLDGHVRFISDQIDQAVWRSVGTIDGRETLSLPAH